MEYRFPYAVPLDAKRKNRGNGNPKHKRGKSDASAPDDDAVSTTSTAASANAGNKEKGKRERRNAFTTAEDDLYRRVQLLKRAVKEIQVAGQNADALQPLVTPAQDLIDQASGLLPDKRLAYKFLRTDVLNYFERYGVARKDCRASLVAANLQKSLETGDRFYLNIFRLFATITAKDGDPRTKQATRVANMVNAIALLKEYISLVVMPTNRVIETVCAIYKYIDDAKLRGALLGLLTAYIAAHKQQSVLCCYDSVFTADDETRTAIRKFIQGIKSANLVFYKTDEQEEGVMDIMYDGNKKPKSVQELEMDEGLSESENLLKVGALPEHTLMDIDKYKVWKKEARKAGRKRRQEAAAAKKANKKKT